MLRAWKIMRVDARNSLYLASLRESAGLAPGESVAVRTVADGDAVLLLTPKGLANRKAVLDDEALTAASAAVLASDPSPQLRDAIPTEHPVPALDQVPISGAAQVSARGLVHLPPAVLRALGAAPGSTLQASVFTDPVTQKPYLLVEPPAVVGARQQQEGSRAALFDALGVPRAHPGIAATPPRPQAAQAFAPPQRPLPPPPADDDDYESEDSPRPIPEPPPEPPKTLNDMLAEPPRGGWPVGAAPIVPLTPEALAQFLPPVVSPPSRVCDQKDPASCD